MSTVKHFLKWTFKACQLFETDVFVTIDYVILEVTAHVKVLENVILLSP